MPSCPHCSRKYTRQSSVNRHIKCKHSGASTRHQCEECQNDFSRRDILERHKQKKHRDLGTDVCRLCSRTFQRRSLQQHIQGCHHAHRTRDQVNMGMSNTLATTNNSTQTRHSSSLRDNVKPMSKLGLETTSSGYHTSLVPESKFSLETPSNSKHQHGTPQEHQHPIDTLAPEVDLFNLDLYSLDGLDPLAWTAWLDGLQPLEEVGSFILPDEAFPDDFK